MRIPTPVAIDAIPTRGDAELQPIINVCEAVLRSEMQPQQWVFTTDDAKDPIATVRDIAARLRVKYPAKKSELQIAQRSYPNGGELSDDCYATLNVALKHKSEDAD